MSKPIQNIQLYNDLCLIEEMLRIQGWCQNEWFSTDGRVCFMGAVLMVCKEPSDYGAVMRALGSVIGKADTEFEVVTQFNDDPCTTFEDVLDKLREAKRNLQR